ncbi:MAG: nitrilase-related carbon-nitrogen hydrolase [Anaeromassilibacillus sp.]
MLGRERIYSCADAPEFTVGVEICEDLWVPEPPSSRMAQCGATVLLNPSASDEVIGKANYRRSLVRDQSARLFCAYAYADAGEGESSTDLVFAGHDLIAENGAMLAESQPFTTGMVTAEVDLQRLVQERRRANTWADRFDGPAPIPFSLSLPDLTLTRSFARLPFVPQDAQDLSGRCEMILHLQASGLKTRLAHTGVQHAVVGLSGGLDSTLALLVTVRAFDALALPRKGILAVTMPGFGTTGRTKGNAEKLAELLGVDFCTVPIGDAVSGHFQDIGHDPTVHDVTYENAQARERTQILMDLANQNGGLVIGTGTSRRRSAGRPTAAITCPCMRSTPPCPKPGAPPGPLCRPAVRRRALRSAGRHPGHPGQPRAFAARGRRDLAEDGKPGRPVRAARLLPLSYASLWFPSVEDLPDGAAHLCRELRRSHHL